MFDLHQYQQEKQAILSNDRLSQKGKDEKLVRLEQKSKDSARQAIKDLRKTAVINALQLRDAQKERLSLVDNANDNLDYARLNYEAQAVKSRITASESLNDVLEVWESVKGSGDAYAIKAFKDTSQGLITEKFGGDDYIGQKGSLFEDIKNAQADIVKVEVSRDELDAMNELRKIQSEAREINDTFGSGQAVVNRVFDGIRFEGDRVQLEFDYGKNKITDKTEKPYEVAWRLEIEHEKAIENYEKAMSEKGLGGIVDVDFEV